MFIIHVMGSYLYSNLLLSTDKMAIENFTVEVDVQITILKLFKILIVFVLILFVGGSRSYHFPNFKDACTTLNYNKIMHIIPESCRVPIIVEC